MPFINKYFHNRNAELWRAITTPPTIFGDIFVLCLLLNLIFCQQRSLQSSRPQGYRSATTTKRNINIHTIYEIFILYLFTLYYCTPNNYYYLSIFLATPTKAGTTTFSPLSSRAPSNLYFTYIHIHGICIKPTTCTLQCKF